jgi:hypothetical protein
MVDICPDVCPVPISVFVERSKNGRELDQGYVGRGSKRRDMSKASRGGVQVVNDLLGVREEGARVRRGVCGEVAVRGMRGWEGKAPGLREVGIDLNQKVISSFSDYPYSLEKLSTQLPVNISSTSLQFLPSKVFGNSSGIVRIITIARTPSTTKIRPSSAYNS